MPIFFTKKMANKVDVESHYGKRKYVATLEGINITKLHDKLENPYFLDMIMREYDYLT